MLPKTLAALATLGLLVTTATGCSKPATDAPGVQSQTAPGGGQSEEHRQIAPLVVKLVPVSENAATGEIELRADFDAREPLSYPLTLTLVPPTGALMVSGAATETINVGTAGRFSKSYKIRTQGPLTQQSFVKLVVDGMTPDKAAGLHAEPRYPAIVETGVPPRQGPSVPGGRPPMPGRRLTPRGQSSFDWLASPPCRRRFDKTSALPAVAKGALVSSFVASMPQFESNRGPMRVSWLLVPLVLSACKTDPSPLTPASGSSAAAPSGDAVAVGGAAVGGGGAAVAPSASASVGEASSATPPGLPPPGGELHPPPSFDAPVKMAIRASGDGKELDFSLDVNVIDTSDIPTTLVIVLPAGATLTKGKASETVSMASAGKKTFDYHLSSPVALTEQTPVRAVLDGRDPQGRSGFHAERRWPERKEGGAPPKSSHTPPPGGRPPMPPRKAP